MGCSITYSSDADGGAVVNVETNYNPGYSGADRNNEMHWVRPGFKWATIQYRQVFRQLSSCWALFGNEYGRPLDDGSDVGLFNLNITAGDTYQGNLLGNVA